MKLLFALTLVLLSQDYLPNEEGFPPPEPVRVTPSLMDGDNRYSLYVDIPDQPVRFSGGNEAFVYRRLYDLSLPPGSVVERVSSFIGTDRGDVVEADVEIYSLGGLRIYQRSLHKECGCAYDAWSTEPVSYRAMAASRRNVLRVVLVARTTGENNNPHRDHYRRLESRVHFGLRLIIRE